MTYPSGAHHPRLEAVLQPQIDPVPWIGLPCIQQLDFEEDLQEEDTGRTTDGTTSSILESYRDLEQRLVGWIAANGIALLRVSLGIVFVWFGALKFVPGG